eukprot:comp12212_c1_seq1/m.6982 comp12212_c1_seq1/g.6982  ORF comp12212_c1_seq1/g.6982 comp12212_c1_seq1/m.6982 type:complete len:189 (-) comp12212_c1_seq1:158-724(-)
MDYNRSKQRLNILDRPIKQTKGEISLSTFALLFSEIIQYCQDRVESIPELEKRLSDIGQRVGIRVLELIYVRDKLQKRETELLRVLYFIQTTVWKTLFGKNADLLEREQSDDHTYMISDRDMLVNSYISVPKEMSGLNCAAFVAGVVEAILVGCDFPARVTAHSVAEKGTTILMKFESHVIQRENRDK